MGILSYDHTAMTNPPLNATALPGAKRDFSHLYIHTLGVLSSDVDSVRFYCESSGHNRVMHFNTNNTDAITVAIFPGVPSTWNHHDVNTGFGAYPDHTAYLPAAATRYFGSYYGSLTEFPFWKAHNYHWGIKGLNNRWECDDYGRSTQDTLHQVWVSVPDAVRS